MNACWQVNITTILLIYLMLIIIPSTLASLISAKLEITQLLSIKQVTETFYFSRKHTWLKHIDHRWTVVQRHPKNYSCYKVFSKKFFNKHLYYVETSKLNYYLNQLTGCYMLLFLFTLIFMALLTVKYFIGKICNKFKNFT